MSIYGNIENVCFDPFYKHANFAVLPILISYISASKFLSNDNKRNYKSVLLFGSSGMGKTYYSTLLSRMFKGKGYVPN